MTSISRTAYPKLKPKQKISPRELEKWYSPTEQEIEFARDNIRGENLKLGYLVQLKTYQRLGYFPALDSVPVIIVNHITLIIFGDGVNIDGPLYDHRSALDRHRKIIREQLGIIRWGKFKKSGQIKNWGKLRTEQICFEHAQVRNDPADIINAVIEQLREECFELPAFKVIDELVTKVRASVNNTIFSKVYSSLDDKGIQRLNGLLIKNDGDLTTKFQELKENPKSPSISNFRELVKRYNWLNALGNYFEVISGVSNVKVDQFAEEARSLDANKIKEMRKEKKLSLIIFLLYRSQQKIRDDMTKMFCVTISKIHKKAKNKLNELAESSQKITHECLLLLSEIIDRINATQKRKLADEINNAVDTYGGKEKARNNCDLALAHTSDDHLPLLWEFYKGHRATIMKLITVLNIKSATRNDSLIKAMNIMLRNSQHDTGYISGVNDLNFVPDRWRHLVKFDTHGLLNHRYFELCVITCLTEELRAGDIYIEGANSYGDYRNNLLSWDTCKKKLKAYANTINIASSASEFVEQLRMALKNKAQFLDKLFPDIAELEIDKDGKPTLKRRKPKDKPASAIRLANEIRARMPERNLIDILSNCHHYTDWASVFAPLSGSDPKLKNAIEKYILTTFTYGTCMGPAEATRHIRADISEKILARVNQRHVSPKNLDKAIERIINHYLDYVIIEAWGDGKSVAGDGTMHALPENNLIAEFHVRYCQTGGIAYHHISNNYIALFSTFIPCGVWEAVYILEGLLQNNSDLQPDTIHADTQGQSEVVFALSYLLGFKLMPRIRNWKNLTMYKYDPRAKYKNIGPLLTGKINWELIKTHWEDMMQAVLSIKEGVISSSLLLRKLTNYSRKNKLYKAFSELGKVIRTLYLLDYISDVTLREKVTETTNKVEAYNNLSDWASFGSKKLTPSNDPDEMEKAIKYNAVITDSIMLQNVVDMSVIINQLQSEGMIITKNDVSFLSPYLTGHLKRFGDYIIDLETVPAEIDISKMGIAWQGRAG